MNKRIANHIDLSVDPIRMPLSFEKAAQEASRRDGMRMLRNNAIAAVVCASALAAAIFMLQKNEPKMASVAHVTQGPTSAALN